LIPRAYVANWRTVAPWGTDAQVEQDLVVSRALVDLFGHERLSSCLAFRGGTALHKLVISPAKRYSEDIDLVQVAEAPIPDLIGGFRSVLDPWLGSPRRDFSSDRVTLRYRFDSEGRPPTPLRLKVEVNTNELSPVMGLRKCPFEVAGPWFSGTTEVVTYHVEELLATKLRALYQRSRGRDLFDIFAVFRATPGIDASEVVRCFRLYLAHQGLEVTRRRFRDNLAAKRADPSFAADIPPLLGMAATSSASSSSSSTGTSGPSFDLAQAFDLVDRELTARLP
jgi:predicted nucleotidyltransferase component of viral defense system